jgi:PAS domain S-box-containing protein
MKLHLFLVSFSCLSYAFFGWYGYRLAPKERLNQVFMGWALFISAWSFLFLISVGMDEKAFAASWLNDLQFSYLPKPVLLLHLILCITGYRKNTPTPVLAVLYVLAGLSVVLGLCYLASFPIGIWAAETLAGKGPGAAPIRGGYAALSILLYASSAGLIVHWYRRSVFRREKLISLYFLGILVFVVASNTIINLFRSRLGDNAFDFLILLQAAQPYPTVFAIDHFRSLRPADSILSERLHSQLSYSVAIVDRAGRITSVNAATEELVGQKSEDIAGRSFEILLSDGKPSRVIFDQSMVQFFEVEYLSQGGQGIPMSLSVTPVRDRWGDCEGYVLIGQPIKRLLEKQNDLGLSKREREVCLLLMQGLTNQEIADRLFISAGTVKNHIYREFKSEVRIST